MQHPNTNAKITPNDYIYILYYVYTVFLVKAVDVSLSNKSWIELKLAKNIAWPVEQIGKNIAWPVEQIGKNIAWPVEQIGKNIAWPVEQIGKNIAWPVEQIGKNIAWPVEQIGKKYSLTCWTNWWNITEYKGMIWIHFHVFEN